MPEEIEITSDELDETFTEESKLHPTNDNSFPVADPVSVAELHEPPPLESTVAPDHDPSILALAPEAAPAHPSTMAASLLRPHAKNCEIMRNGTPEENAELDESIGNVGVRKPLAVTDETCASGYGFVVVGCRCLESAARRGLFVPVTWVSGLSASEEENLIARDNMLDLFARKLSQGDKARTENFFWAREERGSGYRSDLQAPGGTLGDFTKGCNARKAVAAIVHQNENQVRNRHAIFYYAVSPAELKGAVDFGQIALSKGYELITDTIRAFDVPVQWATTAPKVGGVEPTEPPEVIQARADIAAKVQVLLGRKPAKKLPKEPPVPKVLNSATLSLTEGQQRVQLGRRSLIAIPKGDTLELRESVSGVEPILGGPQEDRPLSLVSSLSAVKELLNELPNEFKLGMDISEQLVTDPRIYHEVEVTFAGYPEASPGKVRLTWWRHQGDWWEDDRFATYPRTAPDNPAIHIVGQASQKEELVYFAGTHPYSTIRALKSFLLKVVLYELGPTYGVTCTKDVWLDCHGVELALPRRRAGGPWDPTTPQSIPCPVRVAPYDEIARLPIHKSTPFDLELYGCSADAEAAKARGQYPRCFQLPQNNINYPVIDGCNALGALAGLPVHHAAILAKALGFAIRAPNFFDSGPRPELANAWFVLTYTSSIDSLNRVLLIDIGWIDEQGVCVGVMSTWPEGSKSYGILHSISDIVHPDSRDFPVHILVDQRFYDSQPDAGDSCCLVPEDDLALTGGLLEETTSDSDPVNVAVGPQEITEDIPSSPMIPEPGLSRSPLLDVRSLEFAATSSPSESVVRYLSNNASGTDEFRQLQPPEGANPMDLLPAVNGEPIYLMLADCNQENVISALESLGYAPVATGNKPPAYSDLLLVYGDDSPKHFAVAISNMKRVIKSIVSYVPEDGGVLISHAAGKPQTVWARKA